MATNDIVYKCAGCRYAINVTGKCIHHNLPIQEAAELSCEAVVPAAGDGTDRTPSVKRYVRKKSTYGEIVLYGFLMACGVILFTMALFLLAFSDNEAWRGIWGVIGFIFLGGLGVLCCAGTVGYLKDIFIERSRPPENKP